MIRWDWSQLLAPVVYFVLIGIFVVFAHTGLSGDRGLGALHQAEALEEELEVELALLRAEREALENRVMRLDEGYLDLDLLDERVRAVLGRAKPEELLIR